MLRGDVVNQVSRTVIVAPTSTGP
ncbi:MAG: hypothetical protein ABI618_15460 [Nitrospirota bacterium]